jgi:hypothetical protein
MPLRLNVGVSKKLGLPAYSSVGASCNLDLEIESGLLHDPAGFRDQVRDAFDAAQQAVDDELARLQAGGDPGESREALATNGHHNGIHTTNGKPTPRLATHPARIGKPATPSQVRAIISIARRHHADLDGLLCDLGVTRPEELSLADASRLIDQLKAAAQA